MTGEANAIEGRIHCSRFPRGEPHGEASGSVRRQRQEREWSGTLPFLGFPREWRGRAEQTAFSEDWLSNFSGP